MNTSKVQFSSATTTGSGSWKLEVVLVLEFCSVLDQHEYIEGSVQFSSVQQHQQVVGSCPSPSPSPRVLQCP
eukprot:CAMPEP_0178953132 /NCGR_PEP_ID=MMETSP0789-20121207/8244_1 /TAXON_ID=3005 /ORGANISM="Rhizosolenia setigera, Strain CCMP 1694" /LENGTH=71 /DNA_ID=CAMNT_0020634347 /DNA_START=561 /DNA_END=776 /DNA_ORIENTATION=-